MFGLDVILEKRLEKIIKQMPKKTLARLEKRLKLLFHMSIHDAIKDFEKISIVMSEDFRQEFRKIIKQLKEETGIRINRRQHTVCFSDFEISRRVVFAYSEPESWLILSAFSEPKTSSEMIIQTGISKSTSYRRIAELVDLGLLIPQQEILEKGNTITKYKTLFDGIAADFSKGSISVCAKIPIDHLKESQIVKYCKL